MVRRQEHLTSGNLVVDVGPQVEHLAAVRHSGVWAQTRLDLSGQDLEICFQKSQQWGQHWELVAHQCGPIERTKLTVAISDIG